MGHQLAPRLVAADEVVADAPSNVGYRVLPGITEHGTTPVRVIGHPTSLSTTFPRYVPTPDGSAIQGVVALTGPPRCLSLARPRARPRRARDSGLSNLPFTWSRRDRSVRLGASRRLTVWSERSGPVLIGDAVALIASNPLDRRRGLFH